MRLFRRRGVWAAGLTVAVLVAAGIAYSLLTASGARRFVEFPMQQPRDTPTAIAVAPDGTIWFTIDLADAIGRVREGQLERLPMARQNVEPLGLAVAPDGSVWYTDNGARAVSHMTPSGEVTSFPLETPIVRLGRLAVAPDGAAWFAEVTRYSVTRLKDGQLTRHEFTSPRGDPYGVAVAADGTVWATLQEGDQLLRITGDDEVVAFDVPRHGAVPTDIAVGADGAVWFIEFRENRIGRFQDGKFEDFEIPGENPALTGITVAPDGSVWFGMLRSGSLGRLRDGRVETFQLPRERARPFSLAADRDGNIWYADITGYVGMLPARYARD